MSPALGRGRALLRQARHAGGCVPTWEAWSARGRCWRTSRPPTTGSTRRWARCPGRRRKLAAFHLRDIAGLLPVMNNLIDAMEADQGVPVGVPAAPTLDLGRRRLREQAQGLVEDLRGVEQAAEGPETGSGRARCLDRRPGRPDRSRAGAGPDAGRRGVCRGHRRGAPTHPESPLAGPGPFPPDWPGPRGWPAAGVAESASGSTASPTASTGRASSCPEAPATASRPAAGVDRRLLAQADRAIAALDDFVNRPSSAEAAANGGLASIREELGQLRRGLFAVPRAGGGR